MNLAILNGYVIDPKNDLEGIYNIYIENSQIIAVSRTASQGDFVPDKKIDASGLHVIPGLIDLCARLREPGEEHKATIASETFAAASAGITTIVLPPDTIPVVDTPGMVRMVQDRAIESGFSKIHPLGALTVGLKGERLTDMAMLMDAGCVGVSNASETVDNTLLMRRAMQYASTYDIPVFLIPKDRWLHGNGCMHEGRISTRLGLPAIPEAAETVGVARDLALIETSGARAHFHLISCRRSLQMITEAQEKKVPISVSVSIHHLHLSETNMSAFDTHYKVMPPLRTDHDRDALILGVSNGTITAICSDHQPHGADDKLSPFSEASSGIAGLDSLLPLTLKLVEDKKLTLRQAISSLTQNPARIIGINRGHLGINAVADICIYDPSYEWILSEKSMKSKGKNSPFLGVKMKGKVTATIIGGKLLYQEQ